MIKYLNINLHNAFISKINMQFQIVKATLSDMKNALNCINGREML